MSSPQSAATPSSSGRFESPCLTAALDYLAKGMSPLALCPAKHTGNLGSHRCDKPGKVPIADRGRWKQWQEERPDEDTVRGWWRQYPVANVGIATGPVSGLIAVDVDGIEGRNLLDQLSGGDLPPTWEFITAHGYRYLYRWPEGVVVKNKEYTLEAGEVRILAKGRQTVMPPSVHANGTCYAWEERRSPDDLPAVGPSEQRGPISSRRAEPPRANRRGRRLLGAPSSWLGTLIFGMER